MAEMIEAGTGLIDRSVVGPPAKIRPGIHTTLSSLILRKAHSFLSDVHNITITRMGMDQAAVRHFALCMRDTVANLQLMALGRDHTI